jgi:ferredoxin
VFPFVCFLISKNEIIKIGISPEGLKMKIQKVFAVYFSPTGTTQKAVLAFAEGSGVPYEKIDLTLPKNRQAFSRSFSSDELVVVGLPVYAGRLPRDLNDFFSELQGHDTPAAALVMYGNREYNDALIELKMRLEERGFVVKAGAAFIGEHTFSEKIAAGRPNARDLATAAEYGRKTATSIVRGSSTKLDLPGSYPFVWKGYDPNVPVDFPPHPRLITTESCSQCGLCAESCPWGAIDPEDSRKRDYAKCMICYRCFKNCPWKAIQVTNEKFLAYLPQFETRLNSQRKEPELFLSD